jgi:hypothetical protein
MIFVNMAFVVSLAPEDAAGMKSKASRHSECIGPAGREPGHCSSPKSPRDGHQSDDR